jgi:hypothetical protein
MIIPQIGHWMSDFGDVLSLLAMFGTVISFIAALVAIFH